MFCVHGWWVAGFSGCLLFCAWLSFLSLVWWLRGLGVLPGLLFVGGLGVAWLFCWGWVFFAWPVFSSMFVVGEEGGWVFPAWPPFFGGLGVGWGLFSICLAAAFWLWFCLESLILAQDERWRRA